MSRIELLNGSNSSWAGFETAQRPRYFTHVLGVFLANICDFAAELSA